MVVDVVVVVVGAVVVVEGANVVEPAVVVGAWVVTVEVVVGGSVETDPVVSAGTVVHPVETTTVNATVLASRNMRRPFTSTHTVTSVAEHRHQASPLHRRQCPRLR